MSYEHSMNVEVYFKPQVAIAAAILALKPLSDSFGWAPEALLGNQLPRENTVEIAVEDGFVRHISIYTCGQVSHDFPSVVNAFADQLMTTAQPGSIELRDHDTGDLENAIDTIWFGDPDEVAQAQRVQAWKEAAELLRYLDIPEEMLIAIAKLGGVDSDAASAAVSKESGVEPARLFMQELLDSVETLSGIAVVHGPRTLADVMYLQNAILSGGCIDHYPGESHVLDLARALPSGEQWSKFIVQEYLATPISEA